jgi:hypothetical protein
MLKITIFQSHSKKSAKAPDNSLLLLLHALDMITRPGNHQHKGIRIHSVTLCHNGG